MIFTRKMARQLKKACPGVIEVGYFHWEGDEKFVGIGAAGLNCLLVDGDNFDLSHLETPDEMIGTDIPDRQGFILFDVYCYGKRGDYLVGNEQVLFDSHGNLIWKANQGSRKTNTKTGEIVAEHFGLHQ